MRERYLFAADVRRSGRIGRGRIRGSGCQSGVGRQFGNDPRQGPILRLQFLIFGLEFLQLLQTDRDNVMTTRRPPIQKQVQNSFVFLLFILFGLFCFSFKGV